MVQNRKITHLTILAFYLTVGVCILLLIALFATGLYLQSQRPVIPDVANGFSVPTKIVSGIVFLREGEQTFLHWLSLLSFFSTLCALALKVLGKK